jgi:hypothetical protein
LALYILRGYGGRINENPLSKKSLVKQTKGKMVDKPLQHVDNHFGLTVAFVAKLEKLVC